MRGNPLLSVSRKRPLSGLSCLEHLDSILQATKRPEHGSIEVEFIPFRGWFIVGDRRSFTDDGKDFVGHNWIEAEQGIREYLR